jgi:hypothetical protein
VAESSVVYNFAMKICAVCGIEKPSEDFYVDKKVKSGLHTYCKSCVLQYNKDRRKIRHQDPEVRAKELYRNSENHYKRRHNLTREERDQYILEQGSICGICATDDPGKRGWQLDHDHTCCPAEYSCSSCRRGILCVRCNTAIGLFDDNAEFIRKALAYLQSP